MVGCEASSKEKKHEINGVEELPKTLPSPDEEDVDTR
jgi:hypothetical protein